MVASLAVSVIGRAVIVGAVKTFPDDMAVGVAVLLEDREAGCAGEEEEVGVVVARGETDLVNDAHLCLLFWTCVIELVMYMEL